MWKRALIYGGAIAIATALLTAVLDAADQEGNQALGWVALLFPIAGIVLAIRAARQSEPGEFTFGEGFGQGAAVSLVAALLGALLTYLYVTAISPDYLDAVKAAAEAQLKDMSPQEREAAQGMTGAMTTPGAVAAFSAIGTFITGLIVSALAALFMRRKADPASYS